MSPIQKTYLVTGGTAGLGYHAVESLVNAGARVILTGRTQARIDETKERLGNGILGVVMDQSDLAQVKRGCEQILQMVDKIDGLLLNAAVFGGNYNTTKQGHELTFGVNHLSHYLIVELLKEKLIASAPSRIVIISSESHRHPRIRSNIRYEDFSPPAASYWSVLAYNRSKFANVLHMSYLSRQLSKKGIDVYACHPGNMIRSSITREWWLWKVAFWLASPFTKTISQGAATGLNCLVRDEVKGQSGLYWNQCRPCEPIPAAIDLDLSIDMNKLSHSLVKDYL